MALQGIHACVILALVSGKAEPSDMPSREFTAPVVTREPPVTRPAPPPARLPVRGVPLFINGAILTGVGLTLTALAAVAFAEDAHCGSSGRDCSGGAALGTHLVLFGLPPLVAGLPLLAVGAHRFRVWRAWERNRLFELHPRLGRVRGGIVAGLELRF